MKNKNEGNENKIILGDFNCTMDKMDRYGWNKRQKLYRCCSSYAFIVDNGLRIYGEGRTQIPLSSPFMIKPLGRIHADNVYADIKIANNTESNHIMESFTDHYNAISVDWLPSKTKIGKVLWCFDNSLLWKPEFSSATISF